MKKEKTRYVKIGDEFIPERFYEAAGELLEECAGSDFCKGSVTFDLENYGLFQVDSYSALEDLSDIDSIPDRMIKHVYFTPESLVDNVEPQKILHSLGYKYSLREGWKAPKSQIGSDEIE